MNTILKRNYKGLKSPGQKEARKGSTAKDNGRNKNNDLTGPS
jgi:hypothetical protein